jgi:hypothetical protein
MNPATGDMVMAGSDPSYGQPMAEVVLRICRTPKGSMWANPQFGIDLSLVNKALPGAAAQLRASILAALDFYVQNKYIKNVSVTVSQNGAALMYDVAFIDVRDQIATKPLRVSGSL